MRKNTSTRLNILFVICTTSLPFLAQQIHRIFAESVPNANMILPLMIFLITSPSMQENVSKYFVEVTN